MQQWKSVDKSFLAVWQIILIFTLCNDNRYNMLEHSNKLYYVHYYTRVLVDFGTKCLSQKHWVKSEVRSFVYLFRWEKTAYTQHFTASLADCIHKVVQQIWFCIYWCISKIVLLVLDQLFKKTYFNIIWK